MYLLTLGLNHQTAPLALREKLSFPGEALAGATADLRTRLAPVLTESAIVSTCNRTEVYCATADLDEARRSVAHWLVRDRRLEGQSLHSHLYTRPDGEAVRHAFRVASGLDSMVLGEPQILGQMKDAARTAQKAGALGANLHQLFQRSFAVAKEVRSSTAIGANSVSLAAAAVRLSRRIFEDLKQARVLFVGAGEMIELAATHFAAQHPAEIVVANRSAERAAGLARRFNARTMKLAELPDRLDHFDIVVSCTASTLPIIGLGMVERATRARRRRPMFMVDLAVPRDIEPEVARLDDVFLYTVDDLGRQVLAGQQQRQGAVSQAEAIIETRADAFMRWLSSRDAVPAIRALHDRADLLRRIELDRAQRALAAGHDPQQVLESMAHALTAKFLHGPTRMLHEPAHEPDRLMPMVESLLPSRLHRAGTSSSARTDDRSAETSSPAGSAARHETSPASAR